MSVAKGRNDFEVYIDENAKTLERLILEVPVIIHQEYENKEKSSRDIAKQNSGGDTDVFLSIYNSFIESLYGESEMIEEFYLSMVVMISRYCETTLKRIAACNNKVKNKGISKIDFYYKKVANKYAISLPKIESIWFDKESFSSKRNDIAHDGDVNVTREELLNNLEQVRLLLQNTVRLIPISDIEHLIKIS